MTAATVRKPRRDRRLTDAQIEEIRAVFDARRSVPTDRELAERYGVSVRLVRRYGRELARRQVALRDTAQRDLELV